MPGPNKPLTLRFFFGRVISSLGAFAATETGRAVPEDGPSAALQATGLSWGGVVEVEPKASETKRARPERFAFRFPISTEVSSRGWMCNGEVSVSSVDESVAESPTAKLTARVIT